MAMTAINSSRVLSVNRMRGERRDRKIMMRVIAGNEKGQNADRDRKKRHRQIVTVHKVPNRQDKAASIQIQGSRRKYF